MNPRFTLVIGTFAAVPYVHLQLEARRRLFADVPLLVHDDASPAAGTLAALCRAYGADFSRNPARLPPCKGDLSVFLRGRDGGRAVGADVVVKLSRRFIPVTDWRGSLAALARDSQYATLCAWTTSFRFGFRSECVGLAVERWGRFAGELAARMDEPGEPFVEGFLHNLARRAAAENGEASRAYDARVGERPPACQAFSPESLSVVSAQNRDPRSRLDIQPEHQAHRPLHLGSHLQ